MLARVERFQAIGIYGNQKISYVIRDGAEQIRASSSGNFYSREVFSTPDAPKTGDMRDVYYLANGKYKVAPDINEWVANYSFKNLNNVGVV